MRRIFFQSLIGIMAVAMPVHADLTTTYGNANGSYSYVHQSDSFSFSGVSPAVSSSADYLNFTGNATSSSATVTYDPTKFDNVSENGEQYVERYTNNTGAPVNTFIFTLGTNGLFGNTSGLDLPGFATAYSSNVQVTTSPGTVTISPDRKKLTFFSTNPIANGSAIAFYLPVLNLSSANASGSFTLTENAIVTPEPSTVMMALSSVVVLMAYGSVRSKFRKTA